MLGRHAAPLFLTDESAVGDAEQGVMRRIGRGLGEIDIVGGDQGDIALIGPGHQPRFRRRLRGQAMPLEFDVEPVAEHLQHRLQRGAPLGRPAGREQGIDGAVHPAAEKDQAFGVGAHLGPRDAGLFRRLDIEKRR